MRIHLTDVGLQPMPARPPVLRASPGGDGRYVGVKRVRLQTQQLRRGEGLFFVLLILAAVVVAATSTSAWASSSIRLQIIEDLAGLWVRREPEHRLVGAITDAAQVCSSARRATFGDEFASLAQAIAGDIGQPLECTHLDPVTGDVLQTTSTGLAVYRAGSQLAMFTDGYRHWALRPEGLITWEGNRIDPP